MAEHFEDVLRRRATHGTVALAKEDADRLADLVAAVRECAGDLLLTGFAGLVEVFEALDEVGGRG